jgi:hypothetical protein
MRGAIESARTVGADVRESGAVIWHALSTSVLVEALVHRGGKLTSKKPE